MLQGFCDQRSAIAILYIGRMHDSFDKSPARVGDDMPLTPLDALARIIATRPSF